MAALQRAAPSNCAPPAGDGGTKQLAAGVDPTEQQTFHRRQIADDRLTGLPASRAVIRRGWHAHPYAPQPPVFDGIAGSGMTRG